MALDQYNEEEEDENGMSFLDHLEQLRWHLLRSISAILIFMVLAFLSKGFVFGQVILGPSKVDFVTYRMLCKLSELFYLPALCIEKLPFIIQSRQMTGQFSMHITSSLVVGLIAAFPYVFWEIWRFISPGLYAKERNAARGAVFFVSLLFFMGASFGYFILSPLSINFLSNYQLDPSIANEFDITSYVSTLSMLVLASAVMFQLPVVIYFLTQAGLVSSAMLKAYRRHSIVVILVLSAVITPPDVISQILIAMPILVLYEAGIIIAKRLERKRREEELEDEL
ncbi:twin-arginine translocase subunit TatC [Cyclobacterium marinum]|uniref:Sec-independent protein translocase protein TatC n=1 Tax=Cyclobacterium marinum (strain ATCC 25205 / DSM 745 / LMG 13164 / NCIMB 1802) TaxID=880070 RepID=G0IWV5_CYCMS|nr:twin-arginine translocase subunit TatC [Cyclobacterium marinum]AEL24873.1 Sec-independent protein translocase, TatC subunit [Cyclobacterium marinum DSM 745]MBI0401651.1 twin-arginine translocase subunit TatC [Cyclobacterium marinum]MBR9775457.1 twin-arginine translocase subunit TatC [Cytophagales bacterium]